jgi:uncharacterized coiled-coil DUF342 family protein
MWISRKKYNEIIKDRDNLAAIAGKAVEQNGRLLDHWHEQLEFDTMLNEENKALNKRNRELKQKLEEISALADERYNEIIYLRERIAELERGAV